MNGGMPQGSILGVFLFNTTTDDLEDDFLRSELAVPDSWDPLGETGLDPAALLEGSPVSPGGSPAATTTPNRVHSRREFFPSEDSEGEEDVRFVFLPNARNVPVVRPASLEEPPGDQIIGPGRSGPGSESELISTWMTE